MQSRQESHEAFILKKRLMFADVMLLEKHDNIYIFFYIMWFHLWPRQDIPVICEFLPHSEHGILRLSSIQDNRELKKKKLMGFVLKGHPTHNSASETLAFLSLSRADFGLSQPLSRADFSNWQITDIGILTLFPYQSSQLSWKIRKSRLVLHTNLAQFSTWTDSSA